MTTDVLELIIFTVLGYLIIGVLILGVSAIKYVLDINNISLKHVFGWPFYLIYHPIKYTIGTLITYLILIIRKNKIRRKRLC